MDSQPVLELHGATVLRGDRRVLDGVTLAISAGEHTAVVGPNGSGKSSLIKLLTREFYPLPGKAGTAPVRVFGRESSDVFELRSRMGIVSDELHARLLGGSSSGAIGVRDAVISGFFASPGVTTGRAVTAAMTERAAEALDRMDILHLAGRTLAQLSTGEVRRVLIARALVNRPEVLVLDEPTTGLDLAMRDRFLDKIRSIAQAGTTVLLVTHHLEEIVPEISRVILLQQGKVALDGTKREVLRAEALSRVFEVPISLYERDGYYHATMRRAGSRADTTKA